MTNGILGNPLHTTRANFLNDAMMAGNKEGVQKELLRFAPENAQTKTMEMLQFWPERGFQSRVPACD